MSNPFTRSLDAFRGRKVRAAANDGHVYEGWVERIHHHDRHMVLRGAEFIGRIDPAGEGQPETLPPGVVERTLTSIDDTAPQRTHVDRAFIHHAGPVQLADGGSRVIELPLDTVEPSPYGVQTEFDRMENGEYIETTRKNEWVGSYPVLRVQDDSADSEGDADADEPASERATTEIDLTADVPLTSGRTYTILEGHKRVWAARAAGLTTHPFEVRICTDTEAARRFVYDHIPTPYHLEQGTTSESEMYHPAEIRTAIETIVDAIGAEAALEFYPVSFNVDRLDMDIAAE